MPDREKVIQWLEACSVGCEEGCPYEYDGLVSKIECKADLMRDAVELLKEQEPLDTAHTLDKDINVPGKWISVEDRLPPEAGQYIVAYYPCRWNWEKGPISVGLNSFRGKTKWAKEYQMVTHWMEKPKPPEVNE